VSKVIDLNKRRKGVVGEIVNIVDARELGLVKDKDFHVASIIVVDNHNKGYALGGYLGIKSNDLFREKVGTPIKIAKSLVKDAGVYETPYNHELFHLKFYELKSEIDIDLAIELGFGVIEYNGKYHVYSPYMQNKPQLLGGELVMLKVFVQLLNPKNIDVNLMQYFNGVKSFVKAHILIDPEKHIKQLERIFKGFYR